MSKSAAIKKRKAGKPQTPRSADKAIYLGFVMIGLVFTLLSFPLFSGEWRWPLLAYIALVAVLINLNTIRAYLGRDLANWQKALARLPMRCVGYGTRGGKPLEAARGQPEAKRMMLATVVFSVAVIAGLAWLLTALDVRLLIKRLSPLAVMPEYQTPGSSGMDLHAAIDTPVVIAPGEIRLIPCGLAIAVPPGHEAQVRPRSGLGSRHGISLPNTPGTIDHDYRGEVRVPLINHGREPFTVEPQARIAQMIIAPVTRCEVVEVDELEETVRGAGGFGSTGR